ncbi:MAG: hypothetical protein IT538_03210, partial [Variibacter sp.]|nr:hypothetical protein [Variibacter sp.]
LFGTRRRHYLIFSALLAGALWVVLGAIPRSYGTLVAAQFTLNCALMMASSVLGGLLVEAEQRFGTGGRLVAVRLFVESACVIVAGPLAGALTRLPFEGAALIAGSITVTIVPIAWAMLHEPRAHVRTGSVLRDAYAQFRVLLSSRLIWGTAAFLLLASLPQGYATVLFYHITNELKIPVETIGWLKSCSGIGSLVATVVYGIVGPKLELRTLLVMGLAGASAGILAYTFYRSLPAAVAIELMNGFLLTFTVLALMEAAVWATPKIVAAMGFALLMSALNLGVTTGDILATILMDRLSLHFFALVQIYAGAMALVTLGMVMLPTTLFVRREAAAPKS